MASRDLIDAIGRTPLVRLRTGEERGVEVWAKLELHNVFAMKDRVAKQIILDARARGLLADGMPVVESSSGTMALGLALVGTALGHPVHIVTDPRIDRITHAKLTALGCHVHVVSEMDEHGWQGARLTRLRALLEEHPGAFWPRQYENPQNPAAYRELAGELLADLGELDVVVGAVGSGGSLCGTSRVLRERLPELHVVGVDCVGSVLFGQPDRPHRRQSGLGNSLMPPNLDHALIDEVHWLNDHEAFAATRELAAREKVFAGNTSGSVYRVLTALAERARPGTRIVGIFPDSGDRYTGTVYDDEYWHGSGLVELPVATRPRPVPAGTEVHTWSFTDTAHKPWFAFVESNTTGTGMLALDLVRRKGFNPVLLTNDPNRYRGLDHADAVVCDTNDIAAMTAALHERCEPHLVAAITSTSELYQEAAAILAAGHGLSAEKVEAVRTCRDKGRLREVLAAAGVPQPRFAVVTTTEEVAGAVAAVGTPCVVKPVDDSGSTRVLRCESAEEAMAGVAEILSIERNGRGQPTARRALVESYLDGPEYSVETFGQDGEHRVVAVVAKNLSPAPHFVETRHLVPVSAPHELTETVLRAVEAAGLTRGAAHTEVRLTTAGPAIVEINPRLAGGMIPELVRLASGVDLLEAQLDAASGAAVRLPEEFSGSAGIQFLTAAEAGVLRGVHGVADARAVPEVTDVVVTARPGAHVRPPRDAYDRIGHVIATGESAWAVAETLAKACTLVTVEVEAP